MTSSCSGGGACLRSLPLLPQCGLAARKPRRSPSLPSELGQVKGHVSIKTDKEHFPPASSLLHWLQAEDSRVRGKAPHTDGESPGGDMPSVFQQHDSQLNSVVPAAFEWGFDTAVSTMLINTVPIPYPAHRAGVHLKTYIPKHVPLDIHYPNGSLWLYVYSEYKKTVKIVSGQKMAASKHKDKDHVCLTCMALAPSSVPGTEHTWWVLEEGQKRGGRGRETLSCGQRQHCPPHYQNRLAETSSQKALSKGTAPSL